MLTPAKRRHKFCTFASLTFLTWYVSYDSPLKRCLKNMFLILLCSNYLQVFASWKNLWWNLNNLKLVAKLAQATASWLRRGTSVHKLKTCDDLRSYLIRALRYFWIKFIFIFRFHQPLSATICSKTLFIRPVFFHKLSHQRNKLFGRHKMSPFLCEQRGKESQLQRYRGRHRRYKLQTHKKKTTLNYLASGRKIQ